MPRDVVASDRQLRGEGALWHPHGGVYLDIASRISVEEIKRRLPSMYHQFMAQAWVGITQAEMEVGPTLGCATSPKRCFEVCSEHIKIADHAVIPMTERVPRELAV